MSKEQQALNLIRTVITRAQAPQQRDYSFFKGDSFYAKQAGVMQGNLNAIAEQLEQGIPLERVAI